MHVLGLRLLVLLFSVLGQTVIYLLCCSTQYLLGEALFMSHAMVVDWYANC